MTETTFHIATEFYVMPTVWFNGKQFPATEFHYSIRRDDGSLVYRAGTQKLAEELLNRLYFFTS